jgi:acyl-CoA reductase-like NAD-dependent aldehyde dehydrogenase
MSANAAANVLVSPSALRAVAVVDRSSNLKSAAAALVTARFSFGGRSSYAPDLVLVNEFVLDEFVDLVVREAAGIFSRGGSTIASAEMRRRDASENDFRDDGAVVVVSGDCGTILNVKSR